MVAPGRGRERDEVVDKEAVTAEQSDPLAVGQHEVDRLAVGDPLHAERRAMQGRRDGPVLVEAHDSQRGGVAEDEAAFRAKHTCDLRHAVVRIGERHRPVVAEHEVERRARERDRLGTRLHQRHVGAGPGRIRELGSGQVEPGHPDTEPRERDRPLPTTTAELEDVEPGEVTQRTHL